jgi:hypothetical protein
MRYALGLSILLAVGSVGCIRFYSPGEKGAAKGKADTAQAPEEPQKPAFGAEQAKLDEARQHLEAEEWADAERLALEVRDVLRQHDDRPKKNYPTCKDFDGQRCTATDWDLNPWFDWVYASSAIAGVARMNQQDEIAGLTALDKWGIDPKRCPTAFTSLCQDLEDIQVKEDYVALFEKLKREYRSASRTKTGQIASNYYYVSIPGMAGYSAESVGYFLRDHVVGHLRKNKRRYGAVWIGNHFEAERKDREQGARAVFAWRGTTQKISGTSCRDTGDKVKIGRNTFDVQRCRKSGHISQASTVTMSLSKEDAALIDFDAGDAALVIFETNKVGGSKLRLNLGAVRLARVAHKGDTLQ